MLWLLAAIGCRKGAAATVLAALVLTLLLDGPTMAVASASEQAGQIRSSTKPPRNF